MIFTLFTHSDQSFEGQEAGEKVHFLLYKHWFMLLGPLLVLFFAALIPVLGLIIFSEYIVMYTLFGLFTFLSCAYYLLLWATFFYVVTMYLLDTWIVTDIRIVSRTQKGFFNQIISEMHYARIQDISVRSEGFIPTLLKFGDLEIQTAGAEQKFDFKSIPHPNEVKSKIMELAKHANHVRTV